MGGKGGSTPPMTGGDGGVGLQESMMFMELIQMSMEQQLAAIQAMEPPDITDAPAVRTPEAVDWSQKTAELAERAAADYHLDRSRRKGRMQTIYTSPLLDEDNPNVKGSILDD